MYLVFSRSQGLLPKFASYFLILGFNYKHIDRSLQGLQFVLVNYILEKQDVNCGYNEVLEQKYLSLFCQEVPSVYTHICNFPSCRCVNNLIAPCACLRY